MSGARAGLTHWEGEPVSMWERLWGVPVFEAHRAIGSTNDRLRDLAREGAPAFTSVVAETQGEGRGRTGKRWESPPGVGLWMSFLLRPNSPGAPTLAPILAGLAIARAIEASCRGLDARIKWPNDVEVNGYKVAGILCEAAGPDAVVVGVGLNIRQNRDDFPPDLRGRASSLRAEGCHDVSRAELAGTLLREARVLCEPLPGRLSERVLLEIQDRDALAGKIVSTEAGWQGRALGVVHDGALCIEVEGVRREVRAGGVRVV